MIEYSLLVVSFAITIAPFVILLFSVDAEVPALEDISDVEQEKTDEGDMVTSSQTKSKAPQK